MDRKRGEIGVIAGEDDLLHRRLDAGDIAHVGLAAQPPQQFGQELVRLDPEGARDPGPATGDVADEFLALGADRAEQHRFGIAFEDGRDIGEVGRSAHGLEVIAQRFDETAQAEAVDIGQGRRGRGVRLFNDAHFCDARGCLRRGAL